MTSHQDIQALMAELDSAFPQSSTNSLWSVAGNGKRQREAIAKVRRYLVNLQQQTTSPGGLELGATERQTANSIARAVMMQLVLQRDEWVQPLKMEVEMLRQERDTLLREMRQIESQRLQLTTEFLRVLSGRSSELLKQQILETLENVETQIRQSPTGTTSKTPNAPDLNPSKQLERLEQLRELQRQADQLFVALDTTFRSVFTTLERDLQGYQQSLAQGLERMHELGHQGEVLLSSYFQRFVSPFEGSEGDNLPVDQILVEFPNDPPGVFPFAGVEIHPTTLEFAAPPRGESMPEPPLTETPPIEDSIDLIEELFQLDERGPELLAQVPEPAPVPLTGAHWEEWDEALFNSDAFPHREIFVSPSPGEPLPWPEVLPRVKNETDLFGGIEDPAIKPMVDLELVSISPGRTLEAELFVETETEIELTFEPKETVPEMGLVAEGPTTPTTLVPDATPIPEAVLKDTITSLTELLSSQVYLHEEDETEEVVSDPMAPVTAGENLLSQESSGEEYQEIDRVLAPPLLQQLTEDLANFEDGSPAPLEIKESQPEPVPTPTEETVTTSATVTEEKEIAKEEITPVREESLIVSPQEVEITPVREENLIVSPQEVEITPVREEIPMTSLEITPVQEREETLIATPQEIVEIAIPQEAELASPQEVEIKPAQEREEKVIDLPADVTTVHSLSDLEAVMAEPEETFMAQSEAEESSPSLEAFVVQQSEAEESSPSLEAFVVQQLEAEESSPSLEAFVAQQLEAEESSPSLEAFMAQSEPEVLAPSLEAFLAQSETEEIALSELDDMWDNQSPVLVPTLTKGNKSGLKKGNGEVGKATPTTETKRGEGTPEELKVQSIAEITTDPWSETPTKGKKTERESKRKKKSS